MAETNDLLIEETHIGYDDGPGDSSYIIDGDCCGLVGSIFEGMGLAGLKRELFRFGLREYGRCVSKVYIEGRGGLAPGPSYGWVFQRRRPYEDDPKRAYLHEVWVTVLRRVACPHGCPAEHQHLEPVKLG